jgi:dephospho-CoA kinase
MIVVGLVGKIGAGKTTVARRLAEHGARIVDADALAHEVLEEVDAKRAIVARFGGDVLGPDGRVQRHLLAERVFGPTPAHAEALRALETVVHPRVRDRIGQFLDRVRADERKSPGRDDLVVLDVPLLLRAGWGRVCDRFILIECDDAVRRERLARRNVSPDQQAAREASWRQTADPTAGAPAAAESLPAEKTFTVDTSRDLSYTFSQVDQIWQMLRRRESAG